ncbi:hypothetical protein WJX73_005958 [Symbiochloris irregularis]|uniref:Uncharacterized protein n=1 Tax=Symbiochloris irregularis TaxID=706552 RepID=A0AAW1NY10_9CHLO
MLGHLSCSFSGPSAHSQSLRLDRQQRPVLTTGPRTHKTARRYAVVTRASSGPADVVKAAGESVSNLAKAAGQFIDEVVDDNVLNYCSLDEQGTRARKASLGEKEQQFLNALASFYYDNEPVMTNEEFDNLKEELLWEGSSIAVLSPAEQRFMEASMAYTGGKGYLSDEDYDALKRELQDQNSKVVQQGPRCSLRSRTMYSDARPDYLKITALNIPNVVLVLLTLFAVDDYTGFEITQLMELPQPWSIIVVWGLVLPVVFLVASAITNIVLKDALILKGPCPKCNVENSTYFGDILTVRGNRDKNTVNCTNCKAEMTFLSSKRQIIIQNKPDGDDQGNKAPKTDAEPSKKRDPQPQPA